MVLFDRLPVVAWPLAWLFLHIKCRNKFCVSWWVGWSKKTTQSKSKDRPLREQKNTQLRCENQKCCHFFMGFFPQPIQSHSQNVLAWIVIIYKVWIVCLVFGYAPWESMPETLVTSDDETESNRSTSTSSWDFGTPLARPKHFYRMPQNVIFFDTELIYIFFL